MSEVDVRTLALVGVATATAAGGEDRLKERMRAARAAGVPGEWVEELLLQSFLNVGYPLALVAFGVWREVAGPLGDPGEPLAHDAWRAWAERGAKRCAEVYGRTYHKLVLHLRGLHPAIEPLVLVDAYGKILARPGLDGKRRELCTLAAVAMLDAPRQIHAHLRGALNVGASREEIDAVLAVVETEMGDPAKAMRVWELWADVRSREI